MDVIPKASDESMMELPAGPFRFAEFVLDPLNLQLTRNGEACPLEPKSFRLLQYLIENRHRVIPKDELLSVVGGGVVVSDNALTRAIAQIRKVLDDDPKRPRYIETVPTVGYRFSAAIGTVGTPLPKLSVWGKRQPLVWVGLGTLIILAAGLAAWRFGLQLTLPAPDPVPVPLTAYRGSESAPSFSPDGNQVAFQWNGAKLDNVDIYVKMLGSETPLRLTSDPARDVRPAWSPDGRTVAFLRLRPLDRFDLMLVPALGGPERKLGQFRMADESSGYSATWSADSRWLVVASALSDTNRTNLMKVSVETGVATRILDPGGLMGDRSPRISQDGTRLLFTRRAPYTMGDLYMAQIDANINVIGTPHQIPMGKQLVARAVWTENDQEIFASSYSEVYRLPVTGTGKETPRRVSWIPADTTWVDISRKGHRLAYTVNRGNANIWRFDLTAKDAQPERLIASTRRDVYPNYSPDGKRIAFYSDRGGTTQVWVARADGGSEQQLTFVKPGVASTPEWSPDGKLLAIGSNTAGNFQIYTISAEGGKLSQMTAGPVSNFSQTWSRDGRWMYFGSNRTGHSEVWKMLAIGRAAVQITRNGGTRAVESADGKTLYFSKDGLAGSIWQMPVEGGPEELLTESLCRTNFAVTKRGIYYMTAPGETGGAELKFYSFAERRASTIASIGDPEYGLDVSPDERYLVYAQLDDAESDLMLVENIR